MTNDVPEEDGGHPENVVTNKQLKKYAIVGITFISILIALNSTWIELDEEYIDYTDWGKEVVN